MKNIIFVGAGGLAKELYGYIQGEIERGVLNDCQIKGFLDISLDSYKKMNINSKYLGSEDEYCAASEDEFIIAIGDVKLKEKITTRLVKKGVSIMTYIHSSAIVDKGAEIGMGVVICPNCMVNNQAVIGDFSMLNIYSSVAHDSSLGSYSILSPYATINGSTCVGGKTFMATRSSILPGLSVGEECIISAGVVVSKNMSNYVMAMPKARTVYIEKKK